MLVKIILSSLSIWLNGCSGGMVTRPQILALALLRDDEIPEHPSPYYQCLIMIIKHWYYRFICVFRSLIALCRESLARWASQYGALWIFHGHLSPNNSRKTVHTAGPWGRDMGCIRDHKGWPKFCHCNRCDVCTIVLYMTAIYQESYL